MNIGPSDTDKLRDRASRLFALALNARELGFVSAVELEKLANEAIAQAEDMERREQAAPPPVSAATQQVAQQQQQPQPKRR